MAYLIREIFLVPGKRKSLYQKERPMPDTSSWLKCSKGHPVQPGNDFCGLCGQPAQRPVVPTGPVTREEFEALKTAVEELANAIEGISATPEDKSDEQDALARFWKWLNTPTLMKEEK